MHVSYDAGDLKELATRLLHRKGMARHMADVTADVLIEGDLLGHSTHGLQLLPRYLEALETGALAANGDVTVVSDRGSAVVWDGNYLSGAWLMRRGISEAEGRLAKHPAITIVLRRAGHIGALAVFALAIAEKGYVGIVLSSDPAVSPVAPYGATEGRLTPNPIAAGWPTEGDPVFLDVCPSTTTAGMVGRARRQGSLLAGEWLVGPDGRPSADPAAGPIMPLGGIELGHKGFALALLVEALTAGLGGFGRADGADQDGAAVFLQIIDPEAFGGQSAFRREAGFVAQACRSARPVPGRPPVRMPGASALAHKRRQLQEGLTLHSDTEAALAAVVAEAGLSLPTRMAS